MEIKEYEIKAELSRLDEIFKDYPTVLHVKQVTEILGVHGSTVSRYCREGLKSYLASKRKRAPFTFLKPDVLRFKAELSFEFLRR